MRHLLKHILFRTVLIIITLHAVVAHPHSNELTQRKHLQLHREAHSIIGIIRLTFHESDDSDLDNLIDMHYVCIKKTDTQPTWTKASVCNPTQPGDQNTIRHKTATANTTDFNDLFFVALNGLRAPPLQA